MDLTSMNEWNEQLIRQAKYEETHPKETNTTTYKLCRSLINKARSVYIELGNYTFVAYDKQQKKWLGDDRLK